MEKWRLDGMAKQRVDGMGQPQVTQVGRRRVGKTADVLRSELSMWRGRVSQLGIGEAACGRSGGWGLWGAGGWAKWRDGGRGRRAGR